MSRKHTAVLLLVPLLTACPLFRSTRPTPPPQPNLRWDGPKTYSPTTGTSVGVSGFGINDVVEILPPAPPPYPLSIARDFMNDGAVNAPAGYGVSETVERLVLRSTGTMIGFIPAPMPPVFAGTFIGPALSVGSSSSAVFTFAVPGCGIYRETLRLDSTNAVAESNESDNIATHHFFVPGSMQVSITRTPNQGVTFWHGPPPNPSWASPIIGANAISHTFVIAAATPGTTFHYNYPTAPRILSMGSTAQFIGPPPVVPPAPPVAGPITITLQITPNSHDDSPMTDILTETAQERISMKVTAITSDACTIQQSAGPVTVVHPGR